MPENNNKPAAEPAEVKHYWSNSFNKGKVVRACLTCNPRHSQTAKAVNDAGEVTEWQDVKK